MHPRPIDDRSRAGAYGGPRSLRCTTHYRAHRAARRQSSSDARSRKRAGVDEGIRREVLAEQGGVCAGCKRGPGRVRMNLAADHDHELAAAHDHADDVACLLCFCGFLCSSCNRDIVGMLTGRVGRRNVRAVLAALVDYLDHPPAGRVRARIELKAS